MKPPRPLPVTRPFLSIFTPTFRRPKGLEACFKSIATQTAVESIQHLVAPDHVGYGLAPSLYGRLRTYSPALIGHYIYLMADDDVLAAENVVEKVQQFVIDHDGPEVVIVKAHKGALTLPLDPPGLPPVCGRIDLGSYIVRADIWRQHLDDYGLRYEGDFDHVDAMFRAGRQFAYCDLLFAIGAASNGRPEGDY